MTQFQIRPATPDDAEIILHFIKELAIYEKAEDAVMASVTDIRDRLFDPTTTTEALICQAENHTIGFAVYFLNFSTWLGRNGLYLEDLYISPDFRGQGAGKVLLKYLAKLAVARDCGRFEWSVLDWNTPAIEFYESIGAKPQSEWIGYRLDGKALKAFADS